MWQERQRKATEEAASKSEHSLIHLQDGGWGKRWLEKSMGVLHTFRFMDGALCHDLARISRAATGHYRDTFAAPAIFHERRHRFAIELLEGQLFQVLEHRWVAVEEVQRAKSQCAMRKAAGKDGTMMEMWQLAPECVDSLLAVNFNFRLMNQSDELADDPGWEEVLARLLAKVHFPKVFKHLRPVALLNASATICPRLMFSRFQMRDENLDPRSMGFNKGHSVAELVLCFRLFEGPNPRGGWGGGVLDSTARFSRRIRQRGTTHCCSMRL